MTEIPKLELIDRKADLEAINRSLEWMQVQVDEMCRLADEIKASVEKDHETRGIRVK